MLIAATAVLASLALAEPALGGSAYMSEVWDGQRFTGKVIYEAGWGEVNDVVISMPSTRMLVIRDKGRYAGGSWGWFANWGCWTWNAGEFDGTFPAVCEDPRGITLLEVRLRDGDDSLTIGPSVPSSVVTMIHGERGNDRLTGGPSADFLWGGEGIDELDVRGGSVRDTAHCGYDSALDIDWLYADASDGNSGCEARSVGGQLTSAPAAVAGAQPDWVHVFYRGSGMDLRYRAYTQQWSPEQSLGGTLTSEPAASKGSGFVEVVARQDDGVLWRRWSGDGGALWSTWRSIPAAGVNSGPGTTGRLHLFYRGADHRLVEMHWNTSIYEWWRSVTHDGEITSSPDAVNWVAQHPFAVFARGTDGALYYKTMHQSWQWSGWMNLGGQLTSAPAVTAQGSKRHVFVRGLDNALYWKSFDPSTGWSDWQWIGGRLTQGDPAAATMISSSRSWDFIKVFVRGPDDDLFELKIGVHPAD